MHFLQFSDETEHMSNLYIQKSHYSNGDNRNLIKTAYKFKKTVGFETQQRELKFTLLIYFEFIRFLHRHTRIPNS